MHVDSFPVRELHGVLEVRGEHDSARMTAMIYLTDEIAVVEWYSHL